MTDFEQVNTPQRNVQCYYNTVFKCSKSTWGEIFRGGELLSRGELFKGNCLGVVVFGNYSGVIVLGAVAQGKLSCGEFHGGQLSGGSCPEGKCSDTK